jgi:hypothetical protein
VGHRILKPESGRSKLKYLVFGRAFVNGNIMEGYDHITKDNWKGGVQVEEMSDAGKYTPFMKVNKPLPMPELTILSAQQAFQYVMNHVGATLPKRDIVDARVVEQVKTGKITVKEGVKVPETQFKHRRLPIDSYKIGIITDVSQVGGYPEYKGTPYKDSDNDGMPDAWEKKIGLNPNNAADASLDRNKDGYTNIEEYLNSVVDLKTVKPLDVKKSI